MKTLDRTVRNALRDLRNFRRAARASVGAEKAKYLQGVRNLQGYLSALRRNLKDGLKIEALTDPEKGWSVWTYYPKRQKPDAEAATARLRRLYPEWQFRLADVDTSDEKNLVKLFHIQTRG